MPLYAPNHIESGTGRLLSIESATEQGAESGKYPVKRGEIVYSKIRPALRKLVVAPEDGLCSADMYPIKPAAGVDVRFLFWAMLSNDFSEQSRLASERVAMPKVNREALADFQIMVPPLETQRIIADCLDRKTAAIDALIAKKERLLELLAEKRAALINQAVTKGLDPDVPMKDSGIPWIGEIPAHWAVTKPKFACSCIVDGTHHTPNYVDEGIPFVTVRNLTAGPGISLEQTRFVSEDDHAQLVKRAHPELGDLLITKDGTLGVTRVVEIDTPFSIFVSVALLKLRPDRMTPWFLRYCFEADALWQQFESRKSGSGLKHLILSDIGNVVTPCPPLDEQRRIANQTRRRMKELESIKESIERQLVRIREYRQALITAAVTGQLDVEAMRAEATA